MDPHVWSHADAFVSPVFSNPVTIPPSENRLTLISCWYPLVPLVQVNHHFPRHSLIILKVHRYTGGYLIHSTLSWMFPQIGVPPTSSIDSFRVFALNKNHPAILGYLPWLWKPPYFHHIMWGAGETCAVTCGNAYQGVWAVLMLCFNGLVLLGKLTPDTHGLYHEDHGAFRWTCFRKKKKCYNLMSRELWRVEYFRREMLRNHDRHVKQKRVRNAGARICTCPFTWCQYYHVFCDNSSIANSLATAPPEWMIMTGEPTVATCPADNIDPQGDVVGILSGSVLAPGCVDILSAVYPR